MRRIYELPEQEFSGTIINNCFYVEFEDQERFLDPIKRVRLNSILDWIKEQAKESGLTVKLIKDNENEQIVFIKEKEIRKYKELEKLPIKRLIELAKKGVDYEVTANENMHVLKDNIKLKTFISDMLGKDINEFIKNNTCKFKPFCSDKIHGSCFPKTGMFCDYCDLN
jgi:hypothetical protein